jgi:hypothetical protein
MLRSLQLLLWQQPFLYHQKNFVAVKTLKIASVDANKGEA